MAKWAFDTLGIEVTKEKRKIKKAYAERIKQYHPEENKGEWMRIHEAYEAAMKYAESDEPIPKKYQEEQLHKEQENNLKQRMYELMQIKDNHAYGEWKRFFEQEFTEAADISAMQVLLEIVQAYPLQEEVVRLIMNIMEERAQKYQASNISNKANVAAEIVKFSQAQIPQQNIDIENVEYRSVRKRRKVPVGIIVTIIIVLIVGIQVIGSVVSGTKERKVLQQAAEYLNEKYGDSGYTVEDLEAEKAYLYGDADDKLTAYYVMEKGKYDRVIYALSEKGKTDYTCFDNLQEKEIKQAMQKEVNELTGRTDGRLFWNSSAGSDGAIEDGYFHERYDGDFNAFIEKETTVRESAQKARAKRLYGSPTAKNGNCDYYVPDQTVETMKERMMMENLSEDEKMQGILEEYAEKYQVQFRGMTLPKLYFEGKVQQAAWDNQSLRPEESVFSYQMEPTIPFLMMTGWYVAIPKEDAALLDVENGFYGIKPLEVGKGIYGVQNQIGKEVRMYSSSEMKESFVETEIPKSTQLTDEQRKRAISIQFKGNRELEQEMHLAIDKEIYGIADNGYQVFLTEISEDGEETEEMQVMPYHDQDARLLYRDVLDGEGYLFLEYPSFYEWDTVPDVITIVNP